jgi:hypothetical protein
MAKNKLTRILTAPDKDVKKTFGANGVLSRLFRQMLLDLNIGPPQFSILMAQYLADPRNAVPNNKKDQTSMRGNLNKEFSRPQMTWKVFCKALRFLQITKIEFVLQASRAVGKPTIHSTEVNFGGRLPIAEIDNETKGEINRLDSLEMEDDLTRMAIKATHKHGSTIHSAPVDFDLHEPENPKESFINTQYEIPYLDIDHKTGKPIDHYDEAPHG